MKRLGLALVLAWAGGCAGPGERPVAVPAPSVAMLEVAVQEQIAAQRRELETLLGQPDRDRKNLGFAWGELGMLYDAYQIDEAALVCYREASRLDDLDPRWSFYLARVHERRGELPAARERFEAVRRAGHGTLPVLLGLARLSLQQGELARARQEAEQALPLDPASAPTLFVLAQIAHQDGRSAEAVRLAEAALVSDPRAGRVHFLLAQLHARLGNAEAAARHQAASGPQAPVLRDPWSVDLAEVATGVRVHLVRGSRAMRQGRLPQAIAEFEQAVRRDPESLEGHLNLGAALAQSGRYREAVPILERALTLPLSPASRAKASFNLGVIQAGLGDLEAAERHLAEAARLEPANAPIARELARVRAARGR